MHMNSCVVIVGAGVFGLSTALELTRRGYKNVTVVDRHVPPVCSFILETVELMLTTST